MRKKIKGVEEDVITKQSDIIKLISNDVGVKYEVVRRILRKTTAYLATSLTNDTPVRLGIGTFTLKMCAPKPARNFQTGKMYLLNPRYKIVFTPSSYIKAVLTEKNEQLIFEFDKVREEKEKALEEKTNASD